AQTGAAVQDEVDGDREHEIEDQWREEQRHRSRGEPVLRQVVIDEMPETLIGENPPARAPGTTSRPVMNWLIRCLRAKDSANGAMMATAKSAPRAMRIAVSAKNIHGIRPVRPPTMRTHQRTMTSMTPLFCAKPNR